MDEEAQIKREVHHDHHVFQKVFMVELNHRFVNGNVVLSKNVCFQRDRKFLLRYIREKCILYTHRIRSKLILNFYFKDNPSLTQIGTISQPYTTSQSGLMSQNAYGFSQQEFSQSVK